MLRESRIFFHSLSEIWFPAVCAGCGALGASPCPTCIDALHPAEPLEASPPLRDLVALIRYEDASRPFIADLKYRGAWATARVLGPGMAALAEETIGGRVTDLTITWAPTTVRRARDRGFDQAEVLAREIGHRSGYRVERLLGRVAGPRQTGRTRSQRAEGIEFDAVRSIDGPVLVIDDVVTTGATLRAAGVALHEAGASWVSAVALAATPEH